MKQLLQITLAAFLIFGMCSVSFSQSIDANAEVQAPLNVTGITNLEYGTLNTDSDNGSNDPETEGAFSLSGAPGASVNVSFSLTDLTLQNGPEENSGGDETLAFNTGTDDAQHADNDNGWGDGGNTSFDISSGTDFALDSSDGESYVYVAPLITVDGEEVPGTYQGEVTLTATYN